MEKIVCEYCDGEYLYEVHSEKERQENGVIQIIRIFRCRDCNKVKKIII
jgi:hypothetical protein